MAEQVVDQLEAVEVDIGQGHRLAGGQSVGGQREFALDAAAVEDLGERVVVGHELQLLGGLVLFGGVLQHALDARARQRGAHQEALGAVAAGQLHLGLCLGVHLLVQFGPGAFGEELAPRGAARHEAGDAQHLLQGRVDAQEVTIHVEREQAHGHGLVGVLEFLLGRFALLGLDPHLLGHGQRGQQARGQRGGDAVDDAQQFAHAERGRGDFGDGGQEADGEGGGEPGGDPVARFRNDLEQAHRHHREAAHRDAPQQRQVHAVRQEHGGGQHRHAQPLHDAERQHVAQRGDVFFQQRLVQGERGDAVQGDGHRAAAQQPFRGDGLAQPLDVPAGRQRGHPQVQHQPAGEQHVEGLAVDQGGDQDEQGQHDHAAVEQARLAVILLDRERVLVGRPLQNRQARRAGEMGAAQQFGRQRVQRQGEAGLRAFDGAGSGAADGAAERGQAGGIPAGHVKRVARRELDHLGAGARHRFEGEPDRGFGQMGVVTGHQA